MSSKEKRMQQKSRPFGFQDKFGYFMGDFGCNMSFSLISTYMFIFYTQYIGIDPLHYSIIILLTKVWDAINDPLIGALVDRLTPKKGDKFRPWLFWGSFPLAFSGCLLFLNTQSWAYAAKIIICVVAYMIWDISYTVVNVPFGSLASVITADPIERSQLSTWRSFGAAAAYAPISIIIPLVVYQKQMVNGKEHSIFLGNRMFMIALILGIIAFIAFQILYKTSIERIKGEPKSHEKFNYLKALKSFFSNRSMLAIAIASLAQIMLVQTSMQTGNLVYQMYFNNGKLASASILAMAAPLAIGAFLVKPLVKRFGKKNLAAWPSLISIASYILLLIPQSMSPIYFILFNTLANIGNGAQMLLIWAMVSDSIDDIEYATGRREEGSLYATYSMVRKTAQGFGQSLIPFILATVIPGLKMDDATTWSHENGLTVKNIAVLLPLIGTVISFLCYWLLYDLTDQRLAEIQKGLGREGAELEVDMSTLTSEISRQDD